MSSIEKRVSQETSRSIGRNDSGNKQARRQRRESAWMDGHPSRILGGVTEAILVANRDV